MFNSNLNDEIEKILREVDTYDGLMINFVNIVDSYKNYLRENAELRKKVKETVSDVVTNDRKTYYKEQEITNLNYYYYFLLIIYIITVIVFIISAFAFPTNLNRITKFIILILLIIYPFLSTGLLAWFISIYIYLVNLLPKNVYVSK